MKFSIVIPAFNEENTIAEIVEKVKNVAYPGRYEIIVINDASTDSTAKKLKKIKGIRLVTNKKNKGKGFCVRKAIKLAKGEIIIIQDADLEYEPRDHLKLIARMKNEQINVVFGSRFLKQIVPKPKYKIFYWGNIFLSLLTRLLYGQKITDMETCYKLFKKHTFLKLNLVQNRFGFEPELTCKLIKNNERIVEVPISYNSRGYDEGKKIGLLDGLQAVYLLLKYRFN